MSKGNSVASIDPELLAPVAAQFLASRRCKLSPWETVELLRIAQSLSCADSARAAGVSYDAIRSRRKRLYRKLGFTTATPQDVVSALLAISLQMLAAAARDVTSTRPADVSSTPIRAKAKS